MLLLIGSAFIDVQTRYVLALQWDWIKNKEKTFVFECMQMLELHNVQGIPKAVWNNTVTVYSLITHKLCATFKFQG